MTRNPRTGLVEPGISEATETTSGNETTTNGKTVHDFAPGKALVIDQKEFSPDNPLSNPLIILKILEYLNTVSDLKRFRRVCKLWESLSLTQWRQVATVKLTANHGMAGWCISSFWKRFGHPRDPTTLAEKPYRRYIFYDVTIGNWTMNTFWDAIGPLITYIKFEKCRFREDELTIFETIIAQKLPNLNKLVFVGNQVSGTGIRDSRLDRCFLKLYRYRATIHRNRNLKDIIIKGEIPMCFVAILLNSPNVEMTQKAEDALRGHVSNVQVIRNQGDKNIHPTGDCCVVKLAKIKIENRRREAGSIQKQPYLKVPTYRFGGKCCSAPTINYNIPRIN